MPGDLLWIGGSPCSGKSTVAANLAAAGGVTLYSCDDAFERHATGGPVLRKVTGMSIGDRLAQPLDVQVDDVFRLYREEFPLILDDLREVGDGTVVEGAGDRDRRWRRRATDHRYGCSSSVDRCRPVRRPSHPDRGKP